MDYYSSNLLGDSRNLDFQRSILDAHLRSVTKACRDSHSHELARELVPLGELLQENAEILDDELNYKDNLLPPIVDWFSSKFFRWFQPPCCDKCSTHLGYRGSSVNQERKLVEHYACDNETCDFRFDFIRHNEPAILLHTRTGRCGEWAMCFFIILRALDFDTRIVYDTTDHVWNEVWSDAKGRWLHVDPCESVVDTPLLYEVGWVKELEYCLAMGQYEILDVTQRYTINFDSTQRRRNDCDESWLSTRLNTMTEELLKLAPTDEIRESVRHKRREDVIYLKSLASSCRRIPDKSELAGRKTGSVQWRIARGEYKPSDASRFIIKADPSSEQSKLECPLFGLYYNSDGNTYKSTESQYDGKRNWLSFAYEYHNLDFKYERDWKMSYLARYETCPFNERGLVRWRFDLSKLDGLWTSMTLFIACEVYPNTCVRLSLESHAHGQSESAIQTMDLPANTKIEIPRQEFNEGVKFIDLVAVLEGGDSRDEVAWQKPQLFRQARNCDPKRPSALSVEFR